MPSEFPTTAIVTILDMLTTYLLHSTLLLASVALIAWCCKQSHALTERLWKSAAVIPLLTVPLQLSCGVGNSVLSPRWSEPVVEVVKAEQSNLSIPEIIPVENDDPDPTPLEAVGKSQKSESGVVSTAPTLLWVPVADSSELYPLEAPVTDRNDLAQVTDTAAIDTALPIPTATPFVTKPTSIVRQSILPRFATWLAGLAVAIVATGLLRFFIAGRWFRRRVRKFRAVESGRVSDSLTRIVQRTSLRRRVRLLETDDVSEPIAFGIWRWTIVVPQGIETRLDQDELEAMLAHELAHLVRGDAWWLLVGRLLCCCLPFQPFNFLARERWKQAAEFQCDDWAANRIGNPLSLAHCLTRVAEWRLGGTSSVHALPAGGSSSTLSRRVERLLANRSTVDPWKRSRRQRLLTAFTLIVAIVLCWHGPRTTLLAKFGEETDKLASDEATSQDPIDRSLATEIKSLNVELRQLEADLRRVELIVQNNDSPPEMRTLATGLSSRLANLRLHRRDLVARANLTSKDFVNLPNNETQPSTLSTESSR